MFDLNLQLLYRHNIASVDCGFELASINGFLLVKLSY